MPRSISHVRIASCVVEIEPRTFKECRDLVFIDFQTPEKGRLRSIGEDAFYECSSLESLTIPSSVVVIQRNAFIFCQQLRNVKLREGLQIIGVAAFSYCEMLREIYFPSSIKEIQSGAFHWCHRLTLVSFPVSGSLLKEISKDAFSHCESLRVVRIPSSVRRISKGAFDGCSNLTSVELTDGLRWIGQYAFNACKALKNISFPKTVINVHESAFSNCEFWRQHYSIFEDEARFVELPFHGLCYVQSHFSTEISLEKLNNMGPDTFSTTPGGETATDILGMTPFHILALSSKSNNELFKELLKYCPVASFSIKDRWNHTPMDYLCSNVSTESLGLVKIVMESTVMRRVQWLGLRHRTDVLTDLEVLLQAWQNISRRNDQVSSIHAKLARYERIEILSSLELFLWKLKIHQYQKKEISFGLLDEDERRSCRVYSGAEIVIVNILPFLGPLEF